MPLIIQGGMGVGVSGWPLARAVSSAGQLGVVSGTGLDLILTRRLQQGDAGGHVRRALARFPVPGVAQRILHRYFVPGGKSPTAPFRAKPVPAVEPGRMLLDLLVAANFTEVLLAREGHANPVGVNYLEKVQLPTLPSLFGAMLAGVGFVLMGAGIPRAIPGILDRLACGQAVELRLDVSGAKAGEESVTRFDPAAYCGGSAPALDRPRFLAIVSSSTLATVLVRKASGRVDGFVIEGPTAGGHNAPPRGSSVRSATGEPVYGPRDLPALEAFRELGLPFWLAGSYGNPSRLAEALRLGAEGVQVGTAFALCEESGLSADLKRRALASARDGSARVFTDPVASPTGFPFKVLQMAGTLSDPRVYGARRRLCDLGYLRHGYRKEDGSLGWRCPSEPAAAYERKGGQADDLAGRRCLCNALLANIGLAQVRAGSVAEQALLTCGDDVVHLGAFLRPGATTYTAADVLEALLGPAPADGEQPTPTAAREPCGAPVRG